MIIKTETELGSHLKESGLRQLYLLYGADGKLKNLWCKKLADRATGGVMEDFNLTAFEGDMLDMELFSQAVEGLPYLSEKKAVIIQGLDFGAMDKPSADLLCEVLKDIPETTVVIIATASGFGAGTNQKAKEKDNKLIRLADKVGCSVQLGERAHTDKRRMIMSIASKGGCTIDDKAINYMMQNCPGDISTLQNEMDKLIAYKPGEAIGEEDVRLMCSASYDAVIFELAKRTLARDTAGAIRVLDSLIYQREKPVAILASLSKAYVDLYRCKLGSSQEQIAEDFEYPKNVVFRVKNAMGDSRRYTLEQIRRCVTLAANADSRLKSTGGDDEILIQRLIIELMQ